MQWLEHIPTSLLVIAAIFPGLAPFAPEQHVMEKLLMLLHGELRRPVDIFDLIFHLLPLLLLFLKLAATKSKSQSPAP